MKALRICDLMGTTVSRMLTILMISPVIFGGLRS
jgi:hypothetical protein